MMLASQNSAAEKAVLRSARILLAAIALFTAVLVLFAAFFGEKSGVPHCHIQETDISSEVITSDGVSTRVDGMDFPEIKKGDKMILTIAPLGERGKVEDGTMTFSMYHCKVTVYVGDSLIYEQEQPAGNQEIGHRYYMIPLPEGYQDETIQIVAACVEKDSMGAPDPIRIIPGTDAVQSFTQGRVYVAVMMLAGLTLTLFITLLSGIRWLADVQHAGMKRWHEKDEKENQAGAGSSEKNGRKTHSAKSGHELFFMALLTNSIILWYMGYAGLFTIISPNESFLANVEYCALFSLPIPLAGFMGGEATARWQKIACRILFIFHIVFFVIVSFLNFFAAGVEYVDFVIPIRLIILFNFVLLSLCLAGQMRKRKTPEGHFALMGYFLATALGAWEMIRFQLAARIGYRCPFLQRSMVPVAVLIFAVSVLLYYGVQYSRESFEQIEKESLKRLAFTDPLTGAPNRSACDRLFRTIHEEKITQYCLVFADVNYLKHTNDNYGHEQGDTLIREAAGALSRNFKGKDFFGRWGGDEFIAIHFGTLEETKQCIRKTEEDLEHESRMHPFPFQLSLSFGVAESTAEHPLTPEDATIFADQDMYKNKKMAHADRMETE
jgi:diguanylate cyclase (GGDEF)-like protein